MKNKKKTLPKFKSEAEEADFWSENDLTDYIHEFEELPPGTFTLDPELRRKIRERAHKKREAKTY